jgi:hypothetical protein
MFITMPLEFTATGFSAIIVLSGYIWNEQAKRLRIIENEQKQCPFPAIRQDLAQMKTDIEWLKKFLINQTK